jgi:hypothetical protein
VYNVNLKELPENSPYVCETFIPWCPEKCETEDAVLPNDYLRVNIDHSSLDSHEEIKKSHNVFSQDDAHIS